MTKLIFASLILLLMAGAAWGGSCKNDAECDGNFAMLIYYQVVVDNTTYSGTAYKWPYYYISQCKDSLRSVKRDWQSQKGVTVTKQLCLPTGIAKSISDHISASN